VGVGEGRLETLAKRRFVVVVTYSKMDKISGFRLGGF
jgi:hypothetical protein